MAARLHSSAMFTDESYEEKQNLDEDLLHVGLPPLPPIENWLIDSADGQEKREDGDAGSVDVEDFGSIIDHHDLVLENVSNKGQTRQSASGQRTMPRLVFKPTQAVVVILVLVVALCASLTMLVTQAINYNRQQAEASSSASTSVGTGSKTEDARSEHNNAPKAGDASASSPNPTGSEGQNLAVNGNAALADPPAQTGSSTGITGTSTDQSNLVNLNTADSTQLQQIKGVGPVMAQKIIDYRSSIGRFTSVDQLLKVSGIGQKTLEKMRGQVTI